MGGAFAAVPSMVSDTYLSAVVRSVPDAVTTASRCASGAAGRSEDDVRKPYERQPGEPSVAFGAFVVYRDLGPERSLQKVSQKYAKGIPILKRWSALHRWVER